MIHFAKRVRKKCFPTERQWGAHARQWGAHVRQEVRMCALARSWESMNPYMGSMAPDPGPKILMPGIDDIIGNGPNCLLAVSMALAPSALGNSTPLGSGILITLPNDIMLERRNCLRGVAWPLLCCTVLYCTALHCTALHKWCTPTHIGRPNYPGGLVAVGFLITSSLTPLQPACG